MCGPGFLQSAPGFAEAVPLSLSVPGLGSGLSDPILTALSG